jgi:hypothetical protein
VPLPETTIAVSAGYWSTCALRASGALRCFGSVAADSNTPVEADVPADIAQVSVGRSHACILSDTGNVWCWGNNSA